MDPESQFDLEIEIGAGTYGRVYAGTNKSNHRPVAVKVIPTPSNDLGDMSCLREEVKIMSEFKSDFVVECLGSFETGSALWIVMELCEPGSVLDVMRMLNRNLKQDEIFGIGAAVTLSLATLHDRRLIHRDVKAGNVLVCKDGKIKLADFGVSARLSTIHSKRDTVIGAPFWMAPEVINAESHDSKADIWSLGVSLIEMAQGKPPHSHIHPIRVVFEIAKSPPPTLEEMDKWSPQFHSFLSRCLVKDPKERASAKELLDHPFIRSAVVDFQAKKQNPHILALVEASMPLVNDFRVARMQERDGDGGGTLASGTLQRGDGTGTLHQTQ